MSQPVDTSIQAPLHAASSVDLIVIGAGVFGLWAARHALKRGERVLVLEKRLVGAGASGGFLGSLMPHMPDRWNAKKQMQFDGLVSLADAVGELEADTGLDCGYRRCGRLMPMRHERMLAHLEERMASAKTNWVDVSGDKAFTMEHVLAGEIAGSFTAPDGRPWLDPAMAPFGAQYDTLSARISPRDYLSALAVFVRDHPKGEIRQGIAVETVMQDGAGVVVRSGDGSRYSAGRAVIANGWEAYDLLSQLHGGVGAMAYGMKVTGRGVKGQAVLLDLAHDDDLPIVYDSGSYIVPHGAVMGTDQAGGPARIAVGSTSIDDWQTEPDAAEEMRQAYDPADARFLEHAISLVPALDRAAVTEHWANVRPRNTIPDPVSGKIGSEPVFGPLDGAEQISLAIGGFKISFGIAHLCTI